MREMTHASATVCMYRVGQPTPLVSYTTHAHSRGRRNNIPDWGGGKTVAQAKKIPEEIAGMWFDRTHVVR